MAKRLAARPVMTRTVKVHEPARRPGNLRHFAMAVFLFCVTLLAYLPCLNGDPIMDDAVHITKPELQSLHGLARIWFELGATPQYYPLLHSAFWIEHRLWGDAVLGYHLTNLLLHTLSALLVVMIVRRLSLPGAWLAGFIFALHPVCVNSVAWIAEQKSTLSMFFYLSAALVYLYFDETRRRLYYVLALGLFILALLSKTVTATLPGALLAVFWWRRGRLNWKRDAQPLLPWFAIGAAAGLFTAWVEREYIGAKGPDFAMPPLERFLVAGRVIWFYLGKLLWPVNLTFIYPRWKVDSAVWWQYLFPLAAMALAAGLAVLAWRRRGPLAGFIFFAGTLFPVLGFLNVYPFQYSYVSDHFQYIASLGIIVPLAAGLTLAGARIPLANRWLPSLPAGILLATLGVLTWRVSNIYRGPETLYSDTVSRNPACWVAHNNLGSTLLEIGRTSEAIGHFEAALRIKPDLAGTHNNLGGALARVNGRLPEAIFHFRAALRIQPDFVDAHMNLANALSQIPEHLTEAIPEYEAVLRSAPDYPEAHNNLGVALSMVPGRSRDAIRQVEAALQQDPNSADAHLSLGRLLTNDGRMAEGLTHLEAAVRIRPGFAEGQYYLGATLSKVPGRMPDALAHLEASLRLKPDAELRQMIDLLRNQ
jgi:tetratricopeptide (TPR) repeat protein